MLRYIGRWRAVSVTIALFSSPMTLVTSLPLYQCRCYHKRYTLNIIKIYLRYILDILKIYSWYTFSASPKLASSTDSCASDRLGARSSSASVCRWPRTWPWLGQVGLTLVNVWSSKLKEPEPQTQSSGLSKTPQCWPNSPCRKARPLSYSRSTLISFRWGGTCVFLYQIWTWSAPVSFFLPILNLVRFLCHPASSTRSLCPLDPRILEVCGTLRWIFIAVVSTQYQPKVSDRPTKTGRQLQSVAKQFGSIGKTVSPDADENYADGVTIADADAADDANTAAPPLFFYSLALRWVI